MKRRKYKPPKGSLSESELEQKFYNLILSNRLPRPTQQYLFHPTRKWRFDFAWPTLHIAVEIQGFGVLHNSYHGMATDYEKINEAILLGWKVLLFMAHDLEQSNQVRTLNTVRKALGQRTSNHLSYVDKIEAARRKLHKKLNQEEDDPR